MLGCVLTMHITHTFLGLLQQIWLNSLGGLKFQSKDGWMDGDTLLLVGLFTVAMVTTLLFCAQPSAIWDVIWCTIYNEHQSSWVIRSLELWSSAILVVPPHNSCSSSCSLQASQQGVLSATAFLLIKKNGAHPKVLTCPGVRTFQSGMVTRGQHCNQWKKPHLAAIPQAGMSSDHLWFLWAIMGEGWQVVGGKEWVAGYILTT